MQTGAQDGPKTGIEPGREAPPPAQSDPAFSDNAIHLTRTIQINTLALSQMADQKASILIGANFVVFSLSVTKLIGAELTWAMLSLAATAFISSFFAVMAVLPATRSPAPREDDANLLFFGTFARMGEEEWKQSLLRELHSDEAVLRTMLRDVYQNGQVLYRRKYRFLGLAYRAFLGGLFLTMAIFGLEAAFGLGPVTPQIGAAAANHAIGSAGSNSLTAFMNGMIETGFDR